MGPRSSVSPKPIALAELSVGRSARVTAIAGGRELVRRLMGLGLRVGSEITLLQRRGRGVVLAAGSSRVALGGGVAEKVLVESIESRGGHRPRPQE
ncbi:MAG: FeoA family protein [Chromatiales bacterium]|jgi:ferrous iron transport protein A